MTRLVRDLAQGLLHHRQTGSLHFLHDGEPTFCVEDCMDRVNCRESISTTLTELEVPKDRELQWRRRE